jgi:recombination protein RecT
MSTDLVARTQQVVSVLDNEAYLDQLEALIPDTLPIRRFVQVAKTAIRTNPDLVSADQTSLFGSIIRAAQDGLLPDGHEAALVIYKGKVSYLPMVTGVIRAARDYGWLMRAEVVHEADQFEWSAEPPEIRHTPARPGVDRGPMIAVWAKATRGTESLLTVLDADEVARRRAKAQTDNVWREWPEAMWRKTAAHALFRRLPRSERDRERLLDEDAPLPGAAAELLYGPDRTAFTASPASLPAGEDAAVPGPTAGASDANAEAAGTGGSQQAEPAPTIPGVGSAPGPDDDPEPGAPHQVVEDAEIPNGNYEGRTLTSLIGDEEGERWLAWALRNQGRFSEFPGFHETLAGFVRVRLPDVWATREEA